MYSDVQKSAQSLFRSYCSLLESLDVDVQEYIKQIHEQERQLQYEIQLYGFDVFSLYGLAYGQKILDEAQEFLKEKH